MLNDDEMVLVAVWTDEVEEPRDDCAWSHAWETGDMIELGNELYNELYNALYYWIDIIQNV